MSVNAVAKIDFDAEMLAVIDSQFFPAGVAISKVEKEYCYSVARELGLNPILKEIYFVPRRSKVGDKWICKTEPLVGVSGYLSIAHKSGQLAGISTCCSIKEVPQLDANGNWIVVDDLIAECTVYRKDSNKPFTGSVAYSEYVQKTAEGKPTKFWAEKPETMLKKVAESQVLRKAFNISGVYAPEEMGSYETENGVIISQTADADYIRIEDKNHLSIVKPAQLEAPSRTVSVPPAPATPRVIEEDEETEWPDLPAPKPEQLLDAAAQEIIALLDAKNISYDIIIQENTGFISAKSYDEKELLKSAGFRWSPDSKRWLYKFINEPF